MDLTRKRNRWGGGGVLKTTYIETELERLDERDSVCVCLRESERDRREEKVKEIVYPPKSKKKKNHNLVTLKSFQTCMTIFFHETQKEKF